MSTPNETLKVLSILHYVLGGVTALFACIPFIHVAIGIAILMGGMEAESEAAIVGWIFILFPALFILFGWTMAFLIILTGRKLSAPRSKTFCQVMAGIECVMIPFGTALGITTLVLLSQPEQATLFEENAT
jgi:hypothetical protein